MIFLLAGLAVLAFLVLLGRGYIAADVVRLARSMRALGAVLAVGLAIVFAFTGRAPFAAFALLAAWAIYNGARFRLPGAGGRTSRPAPRSSGAMSRAEAFSVLGLKEGASMEEIRAAHRRLIQQHHPDKGGSDYLAAKINQAKDVLLG